VNDAVQRETAEELYQEIARSGYEVLLDDRDERPGVKFKDADLIGCPIRVTVGSSFIKEGLIEVRSRRDASDRKTRKENLATTIKELAESLR
jgi:prolyl-tRNA synthetase